MTQEDRKALVATMYDFSFRFGGFTFFGFKKGEMPAGIDRAAHQIEEDGKHIEALEAENERLREAVGEIKEAWDWWNVDTYDRCASVVDDAIRAALGEKQ